MEDITGQRLSVWHYPDYLICLMERLQEPKRTVLMMKNYLAFRLIPLCDVVCFGAFPAVICYVLGVRGILGTIVLAYYCVCSVIRLGFFNVLETNRQRVEEGANKYYHGLPITTMAIVLPLAFMLNFVIAEREFSVLLLFVLAVVGTLFIVDFKLRKPSNAFLAVLVILVACAVIAIFLFSKYHISLCFPGLENSILDRLMR